MAWIRSQNQQILIMANVIRVVDETNLTVNGVVVGRFDCLSDALLEMSAIEKWLDQGGIGVYQISPA